MKLSTSLVSRVSSVAAALSIAAGGSIALATAAQAAPCVPTADGHTAAVVLAERHP